MSTAWEILDKQSKAKVDETATWETKYNRVSVEVGSFSSALSAISLTSTSIR
jgi:hypothetical protein